VYGSSRGEKETDISLLYNSSHDNCQVKRLYHSPTSRPFTNRERELGDKACPAEEEDEEEDYKFQMLETSSVARPYLYTELVCKLSPNCHRGFKRQRRTQNASCSLAESHQVR